MTALLRLCRPYYSIPMALAYTLTVLYALAVRPDADALAQAAPHWPAIVLSTAALMLAIAGAYCLNDVFDATIDVRLAPSRPIPAGRVSRRTAATFAVILLAAALVLAVATGRVPFVIALAAVVATLVFYDAFSKRLGLAKQLLAAALMTSIYPLAFALAGPPAGPRAVSLMVFPVWLFLTAFAYELLKDLRDREGDPQPGGRPTHVQSRPRMWRSVASAVILTAAVLLVGPFFAGCGWVYLALAAVAAAAAVASAFLPVPRAINAVYVECFLVLVAATADLLILGP